MTTIDQFSQESLIAAPTVAPLPVSMFLHLMSMYLKETYENILDALYAIDLPKYHGTVFATHMNEAWQTVEQQIITARTYVFSKMSEQKKLTSFQWFRDALQESINEKKQGKMTYKISNQTIKNWRDAGIISGSYSLEDINRAAAVIISSIVSKHQKGFLPDMIHPNENVWWIYSQAPPNNNKSSPVVPCPYPVPIDLAAGTLLWSPWPVFDAKWKQFGEHGAMLFHHLKKETLLLWEPELAERDLQILLDERVFFGMKDEMLHHYEMHALYRLFFEKLAPTVKQPELSLTWPRHLIPGGNKR